MAYAKSKHNKDAERNQEVDTAIVDGLRFWTNRLKAAVDDYREAQVQLVLKETRDERLLELSYLMKEVRNQTHLVDGAIDERDYIREARERAARD